MKTKTKLTIAVASVLSVATLAGTGYAGWVLSHNVEGNANGNMEAYGVADKTVTLSPITFKDTDDDTKPNDSIVWGKAKKVGVEGTWFGYTGDVADEFFTPVLSFTITIKRLLIINLQNTKLIKKYSPNKSKNSNNRR